MQLSRHVAELRSQAADEASFESVAYLTLLDVLGEAAAEITSELAPGSVEVRLRGREPEFVVTSPPGDALDEPGESSTASSLADVGDDAAMTRINMRLPDHLKRRIEQAAERDNISINAWLVRAAAAALDRGETRPGGPGRASYGGQRYRGWAR